MSAVASQVTGVSIVYSTVCSGADQTLQWRHNERDGVSNHQPHDCLLNRLFRRRSRKRLKLRVTGLCAGNSPATGGFPAQRASNAENVSIWWRHHGKHQSSASLAFVRGIQRWSMNSPRKGPVTWKMFPFDDVIMIITKITVDSHTFHTVTYGLMSFRYYMVRSSGVSCHIWWYWSQLIEA